MRVGAFGRKEIHTNVHDPPPTLAHTHVHARTRVHAHAHTDAHTHAHVHKNSQVVGLLR
jgi:hypothetical protein